MIAVLYVLAAGPFVYYLIALYSAWRYFRSGGHAGTAFRRGCKGPQAEVDAGGRPGGPRHVPEFLPPVSNLKPMRGLDPGAYENLASFCRQDYPEYEILFCVDPGDEAALKTIERLKADFPERRIRVIHGSGRVAVNDKVAKLARLVEEAAHEVLVISDSDVRVRPDYLRSVVAPLGDKRVGAVTCFYAPVSIESFADLLQATGMTSDFYAGILTAWQLDGVKFALGTTIATTRSHLAAFGGYASLENQPADDLLVGRHIAEQGYEVALLPYTIETVADYGSMRALLDKRLRWMTVMRHMRPWGHFGLGFTQGLPWSIAAVAAHATWAAALAWFGAYCCSRVAITWTIGVHGLKRAETWKQMPLIPLWDAAAFAIWLASFFRNSIRWRGAKYYIREGKLVRA